VPGSTDAKSDDVDPDLFIRDAIEAGARAGIEVLDPDQRLVFLISEAEVLCDMEGIDSFLERYGPRWLAETGAAFDAVGAVDIGATFGTIAAGAAADDQVVARANELVARRADYSYEAIRNEIVRRLAARG
jgi:hypothetical protein